MGLGRLLTAHVRSPRTRLQVAMAFAGSAFVWCVADAPPFSCAQLPRAFPTDFHARRGFFHVLHWLEQLHTPEEFVALLQAMAAFDGAPSTAPEDADPHRVDAFSTSLELLAHLRHVVAWETYLLTSKMALQWGLLVFLARAKAISTRVAVPSVCLCILSLLCAKMAQSSLLEILSTSLSSSSASTTPLKQRDRAAFMAAFLSMLFLVRFAATAIVGGVLARAYQSFFGGWPPARWKDVPRYIGSKNFALSTLFYSVAAVSVMTVSAVSLRSLSEAVHHIESLALVAALCHFVAHELGLGAEVAPTDPDKVRANEKPKRA